MLKAPGLPEVITPLVDAVPSPQLIVAVKLLMAVALALKFATTTLLKGTPSTAAMVTGESFSGVRVSICEKFTALRFAKVKLPDNPVGSLVFDNPKPVVPAVLTMMESPGDAGGVGSPPVTVTVTVELGVMLKKSFPSRPLSPSVGTPVNLTSGLRPASATVPAFAPVGLKVRLSPAEVPLTVNDGVRPLEISLTVSTALNPTVGDPETPMVPAPKSTVVAASAVDVKFKTSFEPSPPSARTPGFPARL